LALHREEHNIVGAEGHAVGTVDNSDVEYRSAIAILEVQTAVPDGVVVFAPRDEHDIVPVLEQAAADDPADSSRAEDDEAHSAIVHYHRKVRKTKNRTGKDEAPVEACRRTLFWEGEVEVLKVSSRSNPNSVAGAVAGVIRQDGAVEVQVVGAGALNQAVKAVAIARVYLAPSDVDLVCIPSFADVEIDGQGRTAIRLRLEDRPAAAEQPVEGAEDVEQPRTIDLNAEQPEPAAAETERKRGLFSSLTSRR
jgi:stage V sporulation protein S